MQQLFARFIEQHNLYICYMLGLNIKDLFRFLETAFRLISEDQSYKISFREVIYHAGVFVVIKGELCYNATNGGDNNAKSKCINLYGDGEPK